MSYRLKWDGDNVFATFSKDTNYDEIITVAKSIIADARFYSLQFAIFNYLDVDNYYLNDEELFEMATLNKNASSWNKNVRLALIDNDEYIEKMLVKYIQLMNDSHWKIKRFDNLDDSLNWCKRIT